jgi:hypothetical protein
VPFMVLLMPRYAFRFPHCASIRLTNTSSSGRYGIGPHSVGPQWGGKVSMSRSWFGEISAAAGVTPQGAAGPAPSALMPAGQKIQSTKPVQLTRCDNKLYWANTAPEAKHATAMMVRGMNPHQAAGPAPSVWLQTVDKRQSVQQFSCTP